MVGQIESTNVTFLRLWSTYLFRASEFIISRTERLSPADLRQSEVVSILTADLTKSRLQQARLASKTAVKGVKMSKL